MNEQDDGLDHTWIGDAVVRLFGLPRPPAEGTPERTAMDSEYERKSLERRKKYLADKPELREQVARHDPEIAAWAKTLPVATGGR